MGLEGGVASHAQQTALCYVPWGFCTTEPRCLPQPADGDRAGQKPENPDVNKQPR